MSVQVEFGVVLVQVETEIRDGVVLALEHVDHVWVRRCEAGMA